MLKMEKNFVAVLEKGYPRKPYEHFNEEYLKKRLIEEVTELSDAIKEGNREHILSECADVSNLVDYIFERVAGRGVF